MSIKGLKQQHIDKSFIDKILELSEFALKLYHYEIE
jgi:hypothetical protein